MVIGLPCRNGEMMKNGMPEMKISSSSSIPLVEENVVVVHVLAVDDNPVDRTLIQRLLKSSSYQVTAVESAARALEVLGLNTNANANGNGDAHNQVNPCQISLIITDYCMPGMSGYDLLKKLKESSALKDIPVVIMSSENVHSRVQSCLDEGAHDFIFKPVKMADVEHLRGHLTTSSNPSLPSSASFLSESSSSTLSLSSSSDSASASSLSSSSSSSSSSSASAPACPKRKIVSESLGPTQTPRQRPHLEQVTVP